MTTHTFQPMDRLDHEDPVEMLLFNDTVVVGRLLKGGINGPSTRSFYTRGANGKIGFIRPVGWRPLVAPLDAHCASGVSPAVKSLEAA
jgi:hypothetical protein